MNSFVVNAGWNENLERRTSTALNQYDESLLNSADSNPNDAQVSSQNSRAQDKSEDERPGIHVGERIKKHVSSPKQLRHRVN